MRLMLEKGYHYLVPFPNGDFGADKHRLYHCPGA